MHTQKLERLVLELIGPAQLEMHATYQTIILPYRAT